MLWGQRRYDTRVLIRLISSVERGWIIEAHVSYLLCSGARIGKKTTTTKS